MDPSKIDEKHPFHVPFTLHARVYYEDTDAGGVVYYANYLRFAERARTEWLRSIGVTHAQLMAEHGMLFVVRAVSCDYRSSAKLDDLIQIETDITRCGAAALDIHQIIRLEEAADGTRPAKKKILAVTTSTIVAVSPEGKVLRIPDSMRKKIVLSERDLKALTA